MCLSVCVCVDDVCPHACVCVCAYMFARPCMDLSVCARVCVSNRARKGECINDRVSLSLYTSILNKLTKKFAIGTVCYRIWKADPAC